MQRASTDETILQDLVEERLETPTVEYKRWMALSDSIARANIARHICALANAGGGYLVFGFEDDGSPSEPHPGDLKGYSQDVINGIVDRYLTPQVHCAVTIVSSLSGCAYPVVRVPSHGAQPICAKRDGPQDEKNRPTGIQRGLHYIRVAGPKSVPIDTPERWREVIHRCVVAERDGLLTSIGRLFERPTAVSTSSILVPWLEAALQDWATVSAGEWPIDHLMNRVAFGFRLLTAAGQPPQELTINRLQQGIRSASFGASDEVQSGAVPFEMSWRDAMKPSVAMFGDVDGYEVRAASLGVYDIPGLWRISTDGRGVDVQPFAEDSRWVRQAVEDRSSRRWVPGTKMSPKFQITHVAERLAFVRRLASEFTDISECELVIDYSGLSGRNVEEPGPGIYFSRSYTAAAQGRRVPTRLSIEALAADLPGATATLVGPIFRLFDGWDVGPDYVRKILENPR